MKSNIKHLSSTFFILIWFTLAFALYFVASLVGYVQIFIFPTLQLFIAHLTRIAPMSYFTGLFSSLAGVVVFSLACIALGLQILQRLLKIQSSDWIIGVTAFVIGEILFSLIFLTLISLYRLTPIFEAILLGSVVLISVPVLRSFARYPDLRELKELTHQEKIAMGLLALIFVSGLLLTSTRLGYDAVASYFSDAKIMAIAQPPTFFYFNDSFIVSALHSTSLFTALIQLFGDQAARMLSWVNGLAIAILGLAIAKEVGLTVRARLWLLAMLVTSTAFIDLLGDGKVELISTTPLLAAIYWMLRSKDQPTKATFILIGFLAGFSIIARPYNIFLAAIFILLFYGIEAYIQYRARRFQFWNLTASMLWLALPIFILGLFHLYQNWIWLKNPIAPLTYAKNLNGNSWQWQFDPRLLNVFRLFYPIIVTFFNSPQSLGNITPLFVAFLPFLLFKEIRRKINITAKLTQLLISAVVTLILWISLFFTVVEIRYVLFIWILLFLPLAQVIENTTINESLQKPIQIAVLYLPIALMAFISVRTLIIALDTYSPIDSKNQAHCYDTYFCSFLDPLNKSAAPGDRVLVLNAYRYYLRNDLFACSSQAEEYLMLESLARQNSPNFWIEAYREGFRYVTYEKIYSEQYSHFGTLPTPRETPAWLQVTTPFPSIKNEEVIYSIQVTNPPFSPQTVCQENSSGNWRVQALLNSSK